MKILTVSEAVSKAKVTKVKDYDDGRPDIYRVDLEQYGEVFDTHAESEKAARSSAISALNERPDGFLSPQLKKDKAKES